MSILIKGIKMPKNCFECVVSDAGGNCLLQDRSYLLAWNEQIKNCPLVEVHEPHGDLIDRDALEITGLDSWYKIRHKIAYAPTVITREDGKQND